MLAVLKVRHAPEFCRLIARHWLFQTEPVAKAKLCELIDTRRIFANEGKKNYRVSQDAVISRDGSLRNEVSITESRVAGSEESTLSVQAKKHWPRGGLQTRNNHPHHVY